ncbi:Lrp/AsnC family transcriptional regulator [Pseudomonas veronii]|uniref:siroheme decarboxylase subunit beta n=1 Tax=Pseudomonas veronii TaxID=76761 RepID=UPI0021C1B64C|nr:Lrp/AsnC family transcriptional regulator [Pseudomonas veronii]MCT8962815.1 Lrp/AsnC family transcriptional regulator [Pseudomonas veronii]
MPAPPPTSLDMTLIHATQAGLPIECEPYRAVAERLGITQDQVIERLRALLEQGIIRRIGVVPNHYALGFIANGMTVWDVDDDRIDAIGTWLASLPDVTHCYRRPRYRPLWPYNLFAMLHGKSHETVRKRAVEIEHMMRTRFPQSLHSHEILFSSAILKKTGIRIRSQ